MLALLMGAALCATPVPVDRFSLLGELPTDVLPSSTVRVGLRGILRAEMNPAPLGPLIESNEALIDLAVGIVNVLELRAAAGVDLGDPRRGFSRPPTGAFDLKAIGALSAERVPLRFTFTAGADGTERGAFELSGAVAGVLALEEWRAALQPFVAHDLYTQLTWLGARAFGSRTFLDGLLELGAHASFRRTPERVGCFDSGSRLWFVQGESSNQAAAGFSFGVRPTPFLFAGASAEVKSFRYGDCRDGLRTDAFLSSVGLTLAATSEALTAKWSP